MNAQQAENLRILIRFMDADPSRMLGMNVIHDCGAPSCAWGWAGTIPVLAAQDVESLSGLEQCFGLLNASNRANELFGGECANAWKRHHVTGPEWAAEARKVLTEHGYSMDADAFAAFMAKVQEPVAVTA